MTGASLFSVLFVVTVVNAFFVSVNVSRPLTEITYVEDGLGTLLVSSAHGRCLPSCVKGGSSLTAKCSVCRQVTPDTERRDRRLDWVIQRS
jgi:hypothetical protein